MEWTRKNIYKDLKSRWPGGRMPTYKELCAGMFFHPGGKALRLKLGGLKTLSIYYPSHVVEMMDKDQTRKNMPSKHYVFLNRQCKGPYYIGMHEITFFDEDEAFIFKMCDGDIENVKTITD